MGLGSSQNLCHTCSTFRTSVTVGLPCQWHQRKKDHVVKQSLFANISYLCILQVFHLYFRNVEKHFLFRLCFSTMRNGRWFCSTTPSGLVIPTPSPTPSSSSGGESATSWTTTRTPRTGQSSSTASELLIYPDQRDSDHEAQKASLHPAEISGDARPQIFRCAEIPSLSRRSL